MDKYVAHYSADSQYEEFETFEEAKNWLTDRQIEDGCDDGFSEETIEGMDFIAKITHRSKYIVEQDKEKDGYEWSEEGQGYFIDGNPEGEEWTSPCDTIGRVEMVEESTDE